jgi:hypothetical protein
MTPTTANNEVTRPQKNIVARERSAFVPSHKIDSNEHEMTAALMEKLLAQSPARQQLRDYGWIDDEN